VLKQLGIDAPDLAAYGLAAPLVPTAFTTEREIRQAVERQIAAFNFEALATRVIKDGIDRAGGRI
jgi:hypothetical protein